MAGSEAVVEGVGVAAAMAESVVAALGAAGALVWAGCRPGHNTGLRRHWSHLKGHRVAPDLSLADCWSLAE